MISDPLDTRYRNLIGTSVSRLEAAGDITLSNRLRVGRSLDTDELILNPGASPGAENHAAADGKPYIARQQADRDEAREALPTHGAARDVLLYQPRGQREQRRGEQRRPPVPL